MANNEQQDPKGDSWPTVFLKHRAMHGDSRGPYVGIRIEELGKVARLAFKLWYSGTRGVGVHDVDWNAFKALMAGVEESIEHCALDPDELLFKLYLKDLGIKDV